jgi:hypothetical protein
MIEHLKRLEELRGTQGRDIAFFRQVTRIKAWQHRRLERTYADLAAQPRYAPAVAFFLDELYGGHDTALRDRDLIRMYPTMKRLLPGYALKTVQDALELDVLSEEFDHAIAHMIGSKPLTTENYLAAFFAAGRREDRLRQVTLMSEVGRGLDRVVKKPLIYSTLKMLRVPARAAGLENMQQFLEAGFSAFRHMQGADFFLDTVGERETTLIERIFLRHPAPFAIIDEWNRSAGGGTQ